MRKTPELIKICSEEFVKKLVTRALPGLTLTHMPMPPRAISASVETQYFLVTKQGPCWDHIVATRRVGAYVPGEFVDPRDRTAGSAGRLNPRGFFIRVPASILSELVRTFLFAYLTKMLAA